MPLFVPGSFFSSALVAAVVGGFVWWATASRQAGLATSMIVGTLVTGGVGFLAGFFGPLFFTHANDGPLLGIFITGPLGFLVGAIGGAVRWFASRHRS